MKLYGDFTEEDWLHAVGIQKHHVPDALIVHGEWNHADNINKWKGILSQEMLLPKWNTVIGRNKAVLTGFANVYGGAMAAAVSHQFAAMGTDIFIQTGYFGGLSAKVNYGDILIVTEAKMDDGVSAAYLPGCETVTSDEELAMRAIEFCQKKNYKYVTGSVLSVSTPYLETEKMVLAWSTAGHLGVDMESAVTLAVANKFNKKAVSLLNLSDHLLKGDTFYSYSKEREAKEAEIDERIRDIALYLGRSF
ncbi:MULTISPECIES: uridine phosphorylase [unclassified Niallia]|uniref:phosphorylase family protein n=1 Tax=unclassified Niallia TaxID=2837522 RepID=UPI001EDABFF7|nr:MULTISPECIES: uridine phosphorylase [unclassified Niallia]MDL0434307.1 uridine phosphorylase [Niallia sp. SS-2023]UPO89056.1 uridine phosphorylase [Niallia sp. Man26]